jgi:alkylation response protein AidB-like acyl-CoA dehydrogenase
MSSSAASERFSKSRTGSYVLPEPKHENVFLGDLFTQRFLQRIIPSKTYDSIKPDLARFGDRAAGEIWRLGRQCEMNRPRIRHTDAWGKRIDEIVTCDAWKRQKIVSAEEGLIAIAYEKKQEEFSRIYQAAKLSLYSPSSGLYSCPLAMTDGAAKTIESNGLQEQLREALERLTSRDPGRFWTSGQWMTEKGGGSDVASGTETVAVPDGANFLLSGYKWFSSATDSDMALTLARVVDGPAEGSKGLSMFFLRTRRDDGSLNGIEVAKLKDKLGTRQLPTAELLLDGCEAELVSPAGRGIPSISSMLSITRMHNIISSVSAMRKIISLARDYAQRRKAFGRVLCDHVLHGQTLARMETETRGCTALMLDLARQLGCDDCGKISDEDALLLRLMTPVAKMYTGKMAVAVASEGLECFGGQGYIEETGLPGILRDAQVLPIWEGTSNIMSLDVLRSATKSGGEVINAFKGRVGRTCRKGKESNETVMSKAGAEIEASMVATMQFILHNPQLTEIGARDLTVSLARIYIAALLLEHCLHTVASESDRETLKFWLERDLAPVVTNFVKGVYEENVASYKSFVLEGYNQDNLAS